MLARAVLRLEKEVDDAVLELSGLLPLATGRGFCRGVGGVSLSSSSSAASAVDDWLF